MLRSALAACLLIAMSGCSYLQKSDDKTDLKDEDAPRIEVKIDGVEKSTAENIRAHLSLSQELCTAPNWRVARLFKRIEEEAGRALRALGYYSPKISKRLVQSSNCWEVTLEVKPGEPVLFNVISIKLQGDAEQDPDFIKLIRSLPLKAGEPANHGVYEQAKREINSLAAERGYFDGRFTTSELKVDPDRRNADVQIVYTSGRRYRFGNLKIKQDSLDPELVRAFFDYQPDTPYHSDTLLELNRSLSDSGYFSQVAVQPQTDQAGDYQIPVDVELSPKKPHRFSAGAGFSTDAGPRGQLGYENRRLNRHGHRLNAEISASLIERAVTTAYRVPLKDPRSEWLSFEAGARQEDTETSQTNSLNFGIGQTKKRRHGWLETRFLEISREDFEVGSQTGIATLLVPGISWNRSVADAGLRPGRGHRLFFELRGGAEALLSDTSFVRARLNAGWLRKLPWGGRVITRGEFGAMGVDEFNLLPPSQRFFTGGDNSVRGYEFQSLGPKDASGDVIGGNYLLVGSFEYEHPIVDKWSVAAFVDSGNAFSNTAKNDGFKTGIGVGARWISPIGPVRLDLAHPLDDPTLIRLHFRLGPDL